MVMYQPLAAIDHMQFIDELIAERQNGVNADFFTGIRPDWRARTQAYLDAAGSPEHVLEWLDVTDKKTKTKFLSLYNSPKDGSVQGVMLDALRNQELTHCLACGEPGAPNTIDHYLPKGKFPHFCVTPANLFRMCDACQLEKLEKTGDANTPRYFLHPYYDAFAAEQVLELIIVPPFDTPTFELRPAATLMGDQAILVTTHIRELAMVSRYVVYFKGQYRRLRSQARLMRLKGLDVAEIIEIFGNGMDIPSPNAWDHVFYISVLNNPALIEFLSTEPLPEYL